MKRAAAETNSRSQKKKKISVDDKEDIGKIESVTLRNFMCHDNFECHFGNHLNFIIGQNGSGKSAVLTGIILALGGKSSVTGRFSNIKGFVKTGKQKAKIEVVLKNCGPFAYKAAEYGKKITVIREITSDGGSQYKLKSESGTIVSTLKVELQNILNKLDIQVDNPVQVLTQETSRNFLLSKHAKGEKLYQFYYKGTGLQSLKESYQGSELMKDEASSELIKKKQALPEMENELKQWRKYLNSSQKISNFRNELLWAGVIAMEKILDDKKKNCSKVEKDIEINRQEIQKCKTLHDQTSEDLIKCSKLRGECDAEMLLHRKTLEDLKHEREKFAKELRQYEGTLSLYNREEKKLSEDIQSLENSINENREKSESDVKEEERRKEEELHNLQNKNANAEAAIESIKQKKASKMDEQLNVQKQIDQTVAEIANLSYKLKKSKETRDRAKMTQSNKVNAFGEHTQHVIQEIKQRKNEFKQPPRGPIGMFLDVKNPKWSSTVEKCLTTRTLKSFCVDNNHDDKVLKSILSKYYRQMPSTIVCQYSQSIHNVSQHKAVTNHPTVLDMLNIKDVQVANALIDQVRIENHILIEDPEEAQNLMMYKAPKNCASAYMMNGDQICLRPYRYYSNTFQKTSSILNSLRKEDIISLEEEVRSITFELQQRESEKNQLNQHLDVLAVDIGKLGQQILKLMSMKSENSEKIKDLHNQTQVEPKDVYCMQGDLQQLQQELQKKKQEIYQTQLQITNYRTELSRLEDNMTNLMKLLRSKKDIFDEIGVKLNSCGQKKETLAMGQKKYETELKACAKKLLALKAQVEEDAVKIEEAVVNAEQICSRIETDRSYDAIQRQIEETEKVITNQSNCNVDELKKKYKEKSEHLNEAKKELKRREDYLIKIDEMLKLRRSNFREIQNQTQCCIDIAFTCILHGNGYVGNLIFNLKEPSLKLDVAPKKDLRSHKNHSILSGGERSFVTIAFLLALWERTKGCFRILDEYDVFMDSSNRQLSVDLLIRKAEEMSRSQFIFLSPLDLPQITASNNIRIHRMVAPKRIERA